MDVLNITAFTENAAQVDAIKAFMKALKIKFEIKDEVYNAQFVEKIKFSEQQIKDGKFKNIKPKDLNNYIDSL